MRNRILNITADGNWNVLPNIPMKCQAINLQARTSDPMYYHFGNDAEYITIKADTSRLLVGKFNTGDIWIQAANNVVMEIEFAPTGFTS